MEEFKESEKTDIAGLEESLNRLAAALGEHAQRLDAHYIMMQNLARDIRQLETALTKNGRAHPDQSTLQLKQAVAYFAENYINPQFYHKKNNKLIGTKTKNPRGAPRSN